MSVSHHGDDREQINEFLKRFKQQQEGNAPREYPNGRLRGDDEGSLAFKIGVDEKHGTVVLDFGKPVNWMGMSPDDAVKLAEMLIEKARSISKEPLTVSL